MAKADKNGRRELSVEQQNAIDLLVTGKTDQEVAEAVGVARQTVCGWRLYHPVFRAELNKRRKEVWGASADKLRSLLPKALKAIEEELESGENRLKVALEVVKMAGIQVNNVGPTDPDAIVAEEARERDLQMMQGLALGGPDLNRMYQELVERAGG